MLYCKKFDYNNLPALQQKIISILPNWIVDDDLLRETLFCTDGEVSGYWGIQSDQDFNKNILESQEGKDVISFFGLDEMMIDFVHFSLLLPNELYGKHIDGGDHIVSLNIPVLNCEKSIIQFFESKREPIYRTAFDQEVMSFNEIPEKDIIILQEEITDKIYALNTKVPHDLIGNNTQTRVAVCLRLNSNIIKNVEDI